MDNINPYTAYAEYIRSEPEYAWALFCNIAVPIMDSTGVSHQIANEAGAHLMQHLFGYDITGHPLYEYGKSDAQQYAEMRIAMDQAEDAEIAASAMSTRSAETEGLSPQDASAVPQADAQPIAAEQKG